MSKENKPIVRVFVHLAAGHDAIEWKRNWEKQMLLGINDASPYGYARADTMGCLVTFSRTLPETTAFRYLRLALRLLLGFDIIHAYRNRGPAFASDAVWTHTESQFLAIALLMRLQSKVSHRPKIIGQAVWLLDRWPRLNFIQRWLYRHLIKEIDVLTVLSPENREIAARLFPRTRVEFVRFGIPNEVGEAAAVRSHQPLRVLCLGNDRHRDWETAVRALGNQDGIEVTIVSNTAKRSLCSGTSNVRIQTVSSNEELKALFRQATLMLVPLKANHHASGITVLQEAALLGLPIISSDTGGLRAYFGDDAVVYIPPSEPASLLQAVQFARRHPEDMHRLATVAQRHMTSKRMGCEAYVRRHVELTYELLKIAANLPERPHAEAT